MLLDYFIFGVVTLLMTGAQCEVTEVFAEVGSQAVLPCKCSSPVSSYAPAIIWSKDKIGTVWRKQKSGLQYWGSGWSPKDSQRARCPHSLFERGDYSLQINNVREGDGGTYLCRVEDGRQVTENIIKLSIIKVSVSSSEPIWGRDVSIICNVTPLPFGAEVKWMLNNSPFASRTITTIKDGTTKSVVSEKASARLTGNWTCVVHSKGKEGRVSTTLTVKGIIEPSEDNTKVYAAVGSAVTLPCVFSPGLKPSNPVLEKVKPAPGRLPASFTQSPSSSQFVVDKSASLKEVRFEDGGSYRCSGIVKGQQLTRNMQLVVAKIDSSIPSKKRGSVTLTCQLTDTSEVTDYEWVHVVYDLNGTQSHESIQKGKTVSISKENSGEWACRFYGKRGILGNVTYHVPLMSGLTGQKSSDPSQNTTAMVGLSLLLIVLLLVLIKMYLNYQRRRRILQYPALETIVHTSSNEREERERNREKK